jgi:hypothetical protein
MNFTQAIRSQLLGGKPVIKSVADLLAILIIGKSEPSGPPVVRTVRNI